MVPGQPEAIVCDQARDCDASAGDTVCITIDPARLMAATVEMSS
jgi:hypothetical protein